MLGGIATLLSAALVITACSSPAETPDVTGPQGEPQYGGVLRVGATGGATTDSMDPHEGLTTVDYARLPLTYDGLVRLDHDGNVQMALAESFELSDDAKEYTIKVREGVTAHDGQPFTAEDVLWNFERILNEQHSGATALGPIDLATTEVVDELTLKLRYSEPFAILPEVLAGLPFFYMVPDNWTPENPVGTGPFVLDDFQPGVRSTSTRFEDYWREDRPYLDEVQIINMADETTQLNALRSGEVDLVNYLSAQSVKQAQSSNLNTIISKSKGWLPITMRTDSAPYDDPRVREALRLAIDREQINQVVFEGYGTVANDVFDPLPDSDLPQRERDVERAKELLAEAGYESLDLEIITNDVVPANRSVAQLFAEQVKEVGINLQVTFQPTTQFFAESYLNTDLTHDYWYYVPYLAQVAGATKSDAPYNATHFNDPEYDELFRQAVAMPNPDDRESIVREMQRIDWERGGNILFAFYPVIDVAAPNVGGIEEDVTGFSFGNYDWPNIWMAQ